MSNDNEKDKLNQEGSLAEGSSGKLSPSVEAELRDKLASLRTKTEELEEKTEELEDRYSSSETRVVGTLAVFAALFTFISVEFQLFKFTETIQEVMGNSLVLLGSMMVFVVVLRLYMGSRKDITWKLGLCLLVYSLLFILIGIWLSAQ